MKTQRCSFIFYTVSPNIFEEQGTKILRHIQEGIPYMGVSENRGTPKSSILIGISIINHPFWGTTIFGNTYIIMMLHLATRFVCQSAYHF